MRVDQARRLKELEQENSRIKKLEADLSTDDIIALAMKYGRLVLLTMYT